MTSHPYSASKHAAKYDFKKSLESIIVPTVLTFALSVYSFIFQPLSEFFIYLKSGGGFDLVNLRKNIQICLTGTSYSYSGYDDYGITLGLTFMLLGVLFALFSFKFIMRKKQVNVFLSSPVDRRTMYKNRVVASLLMMAGAIVIPIIVDIIINACLVGHFGYVLWCGVLLFAECFIYTAAGFALMSLAMSFCTTVVESFFFCGAVAGVPTSVSYFIHSLCYTFLSGYNHKSLINFYYDEAFFAKPSLLHYTSLINPLILGKAFGADYSVSDNIINFVYRVNEQYVVDGYSVSGGVAAGVSNTNMEYENIPFSYILPLIVWAVISIGIILIARKLFIHIKAENAGVHGTRPFASRLFAAEVIIVLFALFMSGYGITNRVIGLINSTAVNIAVCMVAVFIIYFIIMAICRRSIKPKLRELIVPVSTIAVSGIMIAVLSTGGLGYSTYIPDVEDIDKAAITTDITNITTCEVLSDPYSDSYMDSLFQNTENSAIGPFTDKEDIEKFVEINKDIIAQEESSTVTKGIYVCYELKNGRIVSRYYDVKSDDIAYKILSLRDSKAEREELEYMLCGDSKNSPFDKKMENSNMDTYGFFANDSESNLEQLFKKGTVYAINCANINSGNKIKNTPELRKALLDDLLSQTYEQRFKPEEPAIGGILFSNYSDMDTDSYVEYNSDVYKTAREQGWYIYPSMVNTVNYLKSTGEYKLFEVQDEIESVSIASCKSIVTRYAKDWNNIYDISRQFSSSNQSIESSEINDEYMEEYYDSYLDTSMKNYFKNAKTVEDKKQIDELLSHARIYSQFADNDYIIMIKYKKAGYVSKMIPADEIPRWAVQKSS